MKPLKASEIKGNWATLITSWNPDNSLDLTRLGKEIDILIGMNVDGIYSNGTTGEFHTQTESEFDAISALLADKCNAASMPFQIGVSHMSAQISLDRLRRILPLSPSAVQVILPDWFPVTDEEALVFLQKMEETAEGIGLVLYNPPHAKRVLCPQTIGRLADKVPTLVGLKTAGGDEDWFKEMRTFIPNLSVFVPGHLLASGIGQGASGAYSNVACLHPKAAQEWTDLMADDMEKALEQEKRLRYFMDTYIVPFITEHKYCNSACDRLLAMIGGWADVGENMRWPYRSIPASEASRLRPVAREILPEFIL